MIITISDYSERPIKKIIIANFCIFREILDAMDKDSGLRLERVLVDGAMTGNALMMQTLADFLSEFCPQSNYQTLSFKFEFQYFAPKVDPSAVLGPIWLKNVDF